MSVWRQRLQVVQMYDDRVYVCVLKLLALSLLVLGFVDERQIRYQSHHSDCVCH
jgi:hypothetical protein